MWFFKFKIKPGDQAIKIKPHVDSSETHYLQRASKIAMLGSFPPLRGLSSYCLELSKALADRVHVEFISFKKLYPGFIYPGGDLKNDDTYPIITHKSLKVRRRLTWYNPITWITEAFFSKTDLLHAQWWSLPLAAIYACIGAIFKLRGKPVVFTIHNVLSHERSQFYETVSRWLFKLGDHFIVHTEINLRQMKTHYGITGDRISLISHGSLDFYVRNRIDRDNIRLELGIDTDQKVILVFGAIRSYKGVDTALQAFSEVLPEVPDSLLFIAGKLWQKWQPYQQLIEDLGINDSVKTCLEYIPSGDVYKYFEAADLVILPYHHFDSQSGVGSTAVSFHKPMIVSDVGGLPDLVKDSRYVIPPKDPKALARSITGCLKDPTQLTVMAACTRKVAAELGWPRIAQKTCAIYDNLIRARNNIQTKQSKQSLPA
jgi:glycosyltransferase involved in cell wall biosynthesis